MNGGWFRWLKPLAGLLVTGVFVWLLLNAVDRDEVAAALAQVTVFTIAVGLAFLALDYFLRIVRWWGMLRALDPEIPFRSCVWPFIVSISINNLLPLRAGDVLRVVGFRRQLGIPAMGILGTVLIERLLDLMTLLGLFFVFSFGVLEDRLPAAFIYAMSTIAAAGALSVLMLLLFAKQFKRAIGWFADRPFFRRRQLSAAIEEHAAQLFAALDLLRTPLVALRLVLLSLTLWLFEGAVFATVALSLDADTPILGAGFAMTCGTLATLLPSSPGYLGTFDYFTLLGLEAYGATPSVAGAFAVTVHAILWVPLTVAGLIYFLLPGARLLRARVADTFSGAED